MHFHGTPFEKDDWWSAKGKCRARTGQPTARESKWKLEEEGAQSHRAVVASLIMNMYFIIQLYALYSDVTDKRI